jgi:invasion protein IalB
MGLFLPAQGHKSPCAPITTEKTNHKVKNQDDEKPKSEINSTDKKWTTECTAQRKTFQPSFEIDIRGLLRHELF